MHRTMRKNPAKIASLLLGLTLAGGVWAQEVPSAPPARSPLHKSRRRGGRFGSRIDSNPVALPPPQPQNPATPAARACQRLRWSTPPPAPGPGAPEQPTLRPGKIVMSIGGSQKIQALSKKKIIRATSPKPNIVRISPIEGDPTSVLLTGLEAGVIQITLIDEDKKEELVDVVVQVDVEYLKTVLKMAAPTSAITPIPGTNNTIILTGWVAHSEEVAAIVKATEGVVGGADHVTNLLPSAASCKCRLDVAVALVARDRVSGDVVRLHRPRRTSRSCQHHRLRLSNSFTRAFIPGTHLITTAPVGTPNGVASNLFLGVFNSKQDFFGLLQALKTESLAKELAWPSLVCMSGKSASFQSGGQQAIPVPAGLGQVGIQYQDFGTTLEVLPIVLGNGRIYLDIKPGVSSLNAANGTVISGTSVPGLNVQSLHTTVELESGQSLVLGGLVQHEVASDDHQNSRAGRTSLYRRGLQHEVLRRQGDGTAYLRNGFARRQHVLRSSAKSTSRRGNAQPR